MAGCAATGVRAHGARAGAGVPRSVSTSRDDTHDRETRHTERETATCERGGAGGEGGTHSLTLSARAEGERTEKDEIEKETGVRGSALPLRAGCGVCARGAPCRVLAGCRVPCG